MIIISYCRHFLFKCYLCNWISERKSKIMVNRCYIAWNVIGVCLKCEIIPMVKNNVLPSVKKVIRRKVIRKKVICLKVMH